MKVLLKKDKKRRADDESIEWKAAQPFYVNPRGVMIHRVKQAATHLQLENSEPLRYKRHYSVHFWCGNQTNGRIVRPRPRLAEQESEPA